MSFFLGFDLGGTDIKAGIYTETGDEAAVSSKTVELLSPQEGFAERDMDAI